MTAAPPSSSTRPGISGAALAAARVSHVTAAEAMQLVGQSCSGLWIPYPGVIINGQQYGRIRLSLPTNDRKYTQAEGSGAHAYIPAGSDHLWDQPDLVIVEGEFKALSLCDAGFRAIGIGGVTSALERGGEDGKGPRRLLFEIANHLDAHPARRILFLGDTDTAFSAAFSYEAVALARVVSPATLLLPRIPITMPKGIDDVRESMLCGPAFAAWWVSIVGTAVEVVKKTDAQSLAAELARRELGAIRTHPRRLEWESMVYGLAIDLTGAALDGLAAGVQEALGIRPGAFEKTVKAKRKLRNEERGAERAGDTEGPDAELTQRFGEPFYGKSVDGGFRVDALNERWWAARWLRGRHALFDPDEQAFWIYDAATGLWTERSDDSIETEIAAIILDEARARDLPRLAELATVGRTSTIRQALRGIIERKGAWERREDRIHVANGIIDIDTATGALNLRAWRPEDYSRNRLPIPWLAEKAGSPKRFLTELVEPAMLPDDVSLLQRYAGISLLARNLPQKILILTGTPGGGKTTLAKVLQGLVGSSNCVELRTAQLEERFEVYRFRTATMLYGADVAGDFLNHEGAHVLKSLVGGDWLTGEAKNSNKTLQIEGTFHVLITCNSRLQVRLQGDAQAWGRRLLLIPYKPDCAPKEKITRFDEVLIKEEGPEILGWALDGLISYFEDRKNAGGDTYQISARQKQKVDDLLAESESVIRFVDSMIEKAPGCDITTTELSARYGEFCADRGWDGVSVTVFEKRIADTMLRVHRVAKRNDVKRDGKAQRGFVGVRFCEVADVDAPPAEDVSESSTTPNLFEVPEISDASDVSDGYLAHVCTPALAPTRVCAPAENGAVMPSETSVPSETPEAPAVPLLDAVRLFLGAVGEAIAGAGQLEEPQREADLAAFGLVLPIIWHTDDDGSLIQLSFSRLCSLYLAAPILTDAQRVIEWNGDTDEPAITIF